MLYKTAMYLILLFSIYHLSYSENVIEKYPTGLKNRHLLSCRNYCGTGTGVCSCAPICQVYVNCCEDFTDVCRDEAKAAAELAHLSKTFITCYNFHSMVSSCQPSGSTMPTLNTDTSSLSAYHTPKSIQDLASLYELRWGFNQRPLTDFLKGVNYENKWVFNCNDEIGFHNNVTHWDLEIEAQSGESFSDGKQFSGIIGHGFEWLHPSHSISESTRTDFCIPEALRICPKGYRNVDPLVYEKCQSFVSYIRLMQNGSPVFFGNIYCMKCWEEAFVENNTDYTIITSDALKKMKPLGLFASITSGHKSRNWFEMTSIQNTISRAFSWSNARCTYHTDVIFKCSDFVCKPGTFKADNGMCLYNNTFRLAIGDGGYFLTSNELAKLPAVFSCVIGKTIPNVIDSNQQNILQPLEMYDRRLQMSVYVFEINIHWPRSTIDYTNDSLVYEVIDIVSKTLWRYHTARTTIGTSYDKPMSLADKVIDSHKLKLYDIEEYFPGQPLWYRYKGQYISGESRDTMSCLCMRERNLEPNCNLFCWQTSYFPGDLEKIEEYSSSDCFEMFTSSSIPNPTSTLSLLLAFVLLWFLSKSI